MKIQKDRKLTIINIFLKSKHVISFIINSSISLVILLATIFTDTRIYPLFLLILIIITFKFSIFLIKYIKNIKYIKAFLLHYNKSQYLIEIKDYTNAIIEINETIQNYVIIYKYLYNFIELDNLNIELSNCYFELRDWDNCIPLLKQLSYKYPEINEIKNKLEYSMKHCNNPSIFEKEEYKIDKENIDFLNKEIKKWLSAISFTSIKFFLVAFVLLIIGIVITILDINIFLYVLGISIIVIAIVFFITFIWYAKKYFKLKQQSYNLMQLYTELKILAKQILLVQEFQC